MTDKEKIREQANIDIFNLRVAQEEGIITEFGKGKLEALEGIIDFIDSLQEEPVNEDLEEAAFKHLSKYYGTNIIWDEDEKCAVQDFKAGANWQKAKDQETIELAEDHAMLAGMEKMKEAMLRDAVDGVRIRRNKYTKKNVINGLDVTHDAFQKFKDGDKVKIIVVKDD